MIGTLHPGDIVRIKEERYPHKGKIIVGVWTVREVCGELVYVVHILYEDMQTQKKATTKARLSHMMFRRCEIEKVITNQI